jgi:hypothetical protein
LNELARNKINLGKITAHWDDLTPVAASLVTGTVRAYDILRVLTRQNGSASALGAAVGEYGRIAKTIHLLALLDPTDEKYRRSINTQLTVQESRHRLARNIFHGKRGQIYQHYREGQEDQLGALGRVLNTVVLWNTRYVDAAVKALRNAGHNADEADIARLPPLGDQHINMLGRYAFTPPTLEGLRPLRDPLGAHADSRPTGDTHYRTRTPMKYLPTTSTVSTAPFPKGPSQAPPTHNAQYHANAPKTPRPHTNLTCRDQIGSTRIPG